MFKSLVKVGLVSTLSTTYLMAMPQSMCEKLPESALTSMVRSGQCKPVEKKNEPKAKEKSVEVFNDSTAKELSYDELRNKINSVCNSIGGRMNSSGHCYIPSGDSRQEKLKAMEKPYRAQIYRALDDKYKDMEREEICKAVGGSKHSLGCWINNAKNGLQEDINDYLRERKVKRRDVAKNKASDIFAKYESMPKEEAIKYFTKNTGLEFIPIRERSWEKSNEMCKKDGMALVDSKILYKNYYDVTGIYRLYSQYKTKVVNTFINDSVDSQIQLSMRKGKIYKSIYGSYTNLSEGVYCKKLSDEEKVALKEKHEHEEQLVKQYGATSTLDYLQKVVTTNDNKEIKYINQYSDVNKRLGDAYANFYAIDGGGYGSFLNDSVALEYRHDRDWSKNVFKWAFKPDLGERKAFSKGHGTAGITRNGFIAFVNDLKQQSLFKTLSNVVEHDFRDGHAMIVSGEFQDKQGKVHTVKFVFRAKNYSVYIDVPYINY